MNPTERLQAAQRAEIECFTSMCDTALEGLDQLTQLHLQALRDFTRNASRTLRDAMDAQGPQQWAELAQPALHGDGADAAQYVQRLGEITGGMQAGFSQALQQGMDRLQQSGADSAPAGDGRTDWMRGTAEFFNQALQTWSRSQAQAAGALSEHMQRLAADTAQAAAPAAAPGPASRARPAARRQK